jgi:hypothetical protein
MKKGDPILSNKWFQTGNLIINLDWIAFIEFDKKEGWKEATIYMAAGKRKYKKIKVGERETERLQEVFNTQKED